MVLHRTVISFAVFACLYSTECLGFHLCPIQKRNLRLWAEKLNDDGWAPDPNHVVMSRRGVFQTTFASSLLTTAAVWAVQPQPSWAVVTPTGPDDLDPELPPDAVRSYLQYRVPLQTSADFYVFELQQLLQDSSEWGQVGELFQVNNNRGQGIPSRMEREFTNTMRILGLSMPPDTADEMRDAQFAFEKGTCNADSVLCVCWRKMH